MAISISTITELQKIGNDPAYPLSGDYELANDIDASATSGWNGGEGWDPIGPAGTPFIGTLDGKGYIISDLYMNKTVGSASLGLFEEISNATIQNLTLSNCIINSSSNNNAGSICGDVLSGSTISNCHSSGTMDMHDMCAGFIYTNAGSISGCSCSINITSEDYCGGFVLTNEAAGVINNCYCTGEVTGTTGFATCAGFCGRHNYGEIKNSYCTGNVNAGDEGGGFVVDNETGGIIENCYCTGNVDATWDDAGGFSVDNDGGTMRKCYCTGNVTAPEDCSGFSDANSGVIENCYAHSNCTSSSDDSTGFVRRNTDIIRYCYCVGTLIADDDVSGFCDSNTGTITSCFWDTDVSGVLVSDGGTGKTTAEMKTCSTFTGWDYSGIWEQILNDTYPYFGPDGCRTRASETKTDYITVNMAADFNASPTSGDANLTVSFTDTSLGNPTSWLWDFGDGHTSTDQNPTHTYTDAGNHTVTLTASNPYSSDTETKTDYITVNMAADFNASPTSGDANLTVSFTDTSLGNPTSWLWDFGDGHTSTDQHPIHTYTDADMYTVTLTAIRGTKSDIETKVDYITVNIAADFSANPTSGYINLMVNFTDLSKGTPTAWIWDFGDGTTSHDQSPFHTYTTAGVYTVTLQSSNNYTSDTETKVDYIEVKSITIKVESYDPINGNPIDIKTRMDFGTVIQEQYCYWPQVFRFKPNKEVKNLKLFLENKGGDAEFCYYTDSTFIPNIKSGGPKFDNHLLIETPDASSTSPNGIPIDSTSDYIWLDVFIKPGQNKSIYPNFRIIYETK